MMRLVIVESPYSGNVPLNLRYLRACLRDAVLRGESPYASHALLTQPGVLRDEIPDERAQGIAAGFAWRTAAALTVFYEDLGWSSGMWQAHRDCQARGLPFQSRRIGIWETAHDERVGRSIASADWLRSLRGRP
jgi:hypothetical protein